MPRLLPSMKIHKVEQGSDEWFALKNDYPLSASKAQAIATAGAGMETVVHEALTEKYSSADRESYTNEHIERGNDLEEDARAIYELEHKVTVEEVGFITDDKLSTKGGVSPDGLVGKDGLTEIKCIMDKAYLLKLIQVGNVGVFKIDSAHEWQMQQQMLFTKRKWVDYCIYNPNFSQPLLVQRVKADPEKQQKILTGLKLAEKHYDRLEESVKKALKIN